SFQVLAMQYTTLLLLAIGVTAAGSVKWTAQNAAGKTCLIFSANSINAKLNILNPDNVTETINFAINETQKGHGRVQWKVRRLCGQHPRGAVLPRRQAARTRDRRPALAPVHVVHSQPFGHHVFHARRLHSGDCARQPVQLYYPELHQVDFRRARVPGH
ncbi:hypothetical protein PFISCL1PPCAC_29124, partial [Pristionchus fissidentatus]